MGSGSSAEVRSKPLALALLVVSQFMIILDASIVNVALPSIQRDLHFSPESLSWVVNAYVLVFGGFLLLGGRLADILGRRRIFVAGMGLFAFGSLVGGFSTTEAQLIIARAFQGLGAALVSPAALSTVTTIFKEGSERNRALGVWGAAAGSGGAAGALIGGILTEWASWEWILFINVPVGLAAVILAPRLLIESRDPDHRSHDVPGAVTVTLALVALVYAIVDAADAGWASAQTLGLAALSAVLMATFVQIERNSSSPLIKFSILRLPTLRCGNLIAAFNGAALSAMFYATTLYLQQVLGYSALQTGLAALPLSVIVVLFAGVASRMLTRHGFKPVLVVGSALSAAGLLWFTQISAAGSLVGDFLLPSMVCGAAVGLMFVGVTVAAMTGTDQSNAGLGSGLLNTSQQIGAAIGLAVLVSVATSVTGSSPHTGAVAINDGLAHGLVVSAGFAVIALVLSVFALSSKASRAHAAAARLEESAAAA
ncbi:MAG TPA: MFS transporter [Baekduia sp.]|nr:MFS transporter [Baekduia sp.]